ncbi:hypothetical protein [Clostridium diolis]|uniref:hypothetical protein n=1 Tax=Clostridium diolis TaxID=223919 RepID=UPI003AF9344B
MTDIQNNSEQTNVDAESADINSASTNDSSESVHINSTPINDKIVGKLGLTICIISSLLLGFVASTLYHMFIVDLVKAIKGLEFILIFILIILCYSIGCYFVYHTRPSKTEDGEKVKCDNIGCNITIVKLYAKIGYTLFIVGSIVLILLCFVSAYRLIK